ncbi:hypothetical protein VP01_203g1 [Puccinia sorghi]|uniref:Uncharacterized protein n=1 Tax=Puccinia sorghi TaxID=27349 RepID=A0A0L6VB05_9BASI|nr:hypothetical protein VP01_203g1 [Puccinia sorghi]
MVRLNTAPQCLEKLMMNTFQVMSNKLQVIIHLFSTLLSTSNPSYLHTVFIYSQFKTIQDLKKKIIFNEIVQITTTHVPEPSDISSIMSHRDSTPHVTSNKNSAPESQNVSLYATNLWFGCKFEESIWVNYQSKGISSRREIHISCCILPDKTVKEYFGLSEDTYLNDSHRGRLVEVTTRLFRADGDSVDDAAGSCFWTIQGSVGNNNQVPNLKINPNCFSFHTSHAPTSLAGTQVASNLPAEGLMGHLCSPYLSSSASSPNYHSSPTGVESTPRLRYYTLGTGRGPNFNLRYHTLGSIGLGLPQLDGAHLHKENSINMKAWNLFEKACIQPKKSNFLEYSLLLQILFFTLFMLKPLGLLIGCFCQIFYMISIGYENFTMKTLNILLRKKNIMISIIMLNSIDLYLEQEQQDSAKHCGAYIGKAVTAGLSSSCR